MPSSPRSYKEKLQRQQFNRRKLTAGTVADGTVDLEVDAWKGTRCGIEGEPNVEQEADEVHHVQGRAWKLKTRILK